MVWEPVHTTSHTTRRGVAGARRALRLTAADSDGRMAGASPTRPRDFSTEIPSLNMRGPRTAGCPFCPESMPRERPAAHAGGGRRAERAGGSGEAVVAQLQARLSAEQRAAGTLKLQLEEAGAVLRAAQMVHEREMEEGRWRWRGVWWWQWRSVTCTPFHCEKL